MPNGTKKSCVQLQPKAYQGCEVEELVVGALLVWHSKICSTKRLAVWLPVDRSKRLDRLKKTTSSGVPAWKDIITLVPGMNTSQSECCMRFDVMHLAEL
jgi:hypothetical protein